MPFGVHTANIQNICLLLSSVPELENGIYVFFFNISNCTIFIYVPKINFLFKIPSSGVIFIVEYGHFISTSPSSQTSPSGVPPRKKYSSFIKRPQSRIGYPKMSCSCIFAIASFSLP